MDISIFSKGIRIGTQSRFGPIEQVAPPGKATVPLRHGAGTTCRAVVEKGTVVKAGQVIAEAVDARSVDVHAPVGGAVVAVTDVVGTDGSACPAVVLEADGSGERESLEPIAKPGKTVAADLIARIRAAGIVTSGRDGMGLATMIEEALAPRGFVSATGTTIVKPLAHLAVRFCDVDPHSGTMRAVTEAMGDDVADLRLGIDLLAQITGASSVHLVLAKGQSAPAVEKMADDADWALHRTDNGQYPFAADPFVAKMVSGKEPPIAFMRVHESGTLVVDVPEVLDVARAIRDGAVVLERVLTVMAPSGARMCKARIGTPISEIVGAVGLAADYGKVILGGPLGGAAVHTLDHPLTKDVSMITLIPRGEEARFENEPCVSCGLCAMVCPVRLVPGLLSRYCEYGDFERAQNAHLFSCTECGCCAYVCPAGRSMVQLMIHGKSEVLAARRAS